MATEIWWPTIIYQETHRPNCCCGLCNNTACIATIRETPRSQAEYEAAIGRATGRRGKADGD